MLRLRDAQPHAIAGAHEQRIGPGKDARVEGEGVEVEHHRRIGRGRSGLDEPFVEKDREVAIDRPHAGIARMDDEKAVHAEGDLHHLVEMRVIHQRAGLLERELVRERLARRDLRLIETAHAVHAVRDDEAVPVHRGPLGQFVRDEDAHAIAFERLDRRPRRRAVVAPAVHVEAVDELTAHRLGGEMKLLHAAHHLVRQRRSDIRRDHAGATRTADAFRRFGLSWLALDRRRRGRRRMMMLMLRAGVPREQSAHGRADR